MNWTRILNQVGNFQVRSIADPLFKYSLYLFCLGTISAIFNTASWVTILLFVIAVLFSVVGIGFSIHFAKKNPDYLRTEDFQLRKQSIEMLGDKDNQLNQQIKNIVYITSPYSKQLGNDDKKPEFGE